MMEERGYERRRARVKGMSGKAWVSIRLKEHDELLMCRETHCAGKGKTKTRRAA